MPYYNPFPVEWRYGNHKLEQFLKHLISINSEIQFTIEMDENGKLPFLDALVSKKPDDSLGHTVYRPLLEKNLNHHPKQEKNIVNILIE